MLKPLFSETGLAGAGFLLIIAGIFLTQVDDVIDWGKFCISLGVSIIFILLASKSSGVIQIATGIIGGIAFVAAIVFFSIAL